MLFVGVFINRVTKSSTWLAKARGILRLVLISAGASIPVFVISAFIAVFIVPYLIPRPLETVSLLPK